MFGFNWTNTDQGDKQEPPPPGHYRLFGLTVIAFIVMYGLVALPVFWLAHPYQERWPILLLPATPFVSVLGAWKLVVWFGFRRTAVAALVTTVAGTLSHPFWAPPLVDVAPANTAHDWVGTFVIMCGLTGWLMAGAALLIGPIRLAIGWRRHRRERSAVTSTKTARPIIPINWLPGRNGGRRPPDPRCARRIRRLLIIAALATVPLAYFWMEVLQGVVLFLLYVWAFLNFPVTAFAALAAIVFAIGWYLPLWPRKAWQRASMVLAIVIIVHTGWFFFGWVTFHPLCRIEVGIGGSTGQRALIGELDPYSAGLFKRGLAVRWGEAAVQRTDPRTVLVRPAFALLENEWNWNISYHAASGPLPPQLAERKDAECLAIEQNAMLGGKATRWRSGWGLWPWDTINEDEGFARWLRGLYKDK